MSMMMIVEVHADSGGISFGGVAAFIFGNLIIPPIFDIYRKYYGGKMT